MIYFLALFGKALRQKKSRPGAERLVTSGAIELTVYEEAANEEYATTHRGD